MMNRQKRFLTCFLLFCMMICSGLTVFAKKRTPKIFATVSDIRISKKKAKPGEEVRYKFTIKAPKITAYQECEYGVDHIFLIWRSQKKPYQELKMSIPWDNGSKRHKANLRVSGKIKIRKGMNAGKWQLAGIYFNYNEPETEDGNNSLYIRHRKNANYKKKRDNEILMDLSAASFQVRSKASADHQAPVVEQSGVTFAKNKKNQWILGIRVSDKSPLKSVSCVWEDRTLKGVESQESYTEYNLKYNKKTKLYEAAIPVPLKDSLTKESVFSQLLQIKAADIYGNEVSYFVNVGNRQRFAKEQKLDIPNTILYSDTEIQKYVEEHPEVRYIE